MWCRGAGGAGLHGVPPVPVVLGYAGHAPAAGPERAAPGPVGELVKHFAEGGGQLVAALLEGAVLLGQQVDSPLGLRGTGGGRRERGVGVAQLAGELGLLGGSQLLIQGVEGVVGDGVGGVALCGHR